MSLSKLSTLIALIAALTLASTSCQSAKSASASPPPQANAPAITSATAASQSGAAATDSVAQAEPANPKTDPAADLLASVETRYQAGQAAQAAGNFDTAKQSYDRAFDLLMGSPLDIHAEPRLQHELDLVTAALKSLKLQDRQQAEASDEQKPEPAPIDEANEATPPVDANVKAKAEAEMKATHSDLPLMMTDQVAGYINYFSGRGKETLVHALTRSGRYRAMIERVLKEEGVPQDLIYLAQAESGFHPLALSRAGARGMWQFMSSRARGYGLERTRWIDERQDPEKSTRAAARHLKDLYKQFGDWYLAMAAYNSGPGSVQSAVKRTGYADFWELYKRNVLPRETRNYVPIILAVTIMAKNPEQYGLEDIVPDQPVPHDTVEIDYPVDLRLVADCVDASPTTLQDLNPSLLRWTTPDEGKFELNLPAGTKDHYLDAIAAIPADMRIWWRYHKVQEGDTLASIGHAYHTSSQAIAKANNLDLDAALIPDSSAGHSDRPGKHIPADSQAYAQKAIRYKVRRGDTVETVADNFNVPPTMVRRWNRLRGNSLRGRHVLYIHLPVTPGSLPTWQAKTSRASKTRSRSTSLLRTSTAKTVTRHTVKPGETLTSIASDHHTSVSVLQKDNGNPKILRPGMVLIVRLP